MSKRRKVGDIVIKKPGAGFLGIPVKIKLEPLDEMEEKYGQDPCILYNPNAEEREPYECDDPDCIEWANCAILNGNNEVTGYCYHVSECEMEDIHPLWVKEN